VTLWVKKEGSLGNKPNYGFGDLNDDPDRLWLDIQVIIEGERLTINNK
jgi:hypothetical protein